MRTMLGIPGQEMSGPHLSAEALLDLIRKQAEDA